MEFRSAQVFVVALLNLSMSERETSRPKDLPLANLATAVGAQAKSDLEAAINFYSNSGEMYQMLNLFNQTRIAAEKAARDWASNTYEAMKEAQNATARPVRDAETALMRDAMRVNKAIRGDFQDDVAMVDSIDLSNDTRNKIRAEYGQSVLVAPPADEFASEIVGRKVRCNGRYHGTGKRLIMENPLGEVTGYSKENDLYQVRLDADTTTIIDAHRNQFVVLPDEKLQQKLREGDRDRAEEIARRTAELGDLIDSVVVVDNLEKLPRTRQNLDYSPNHWQLGKGGVYEWRFLSKKWKVLAFEQDLGKGNEDARNTFRVVPLDPRNDKKTKDPHAFSLDLKLGQHFHTLSGIKGEQVKVDYTRGGETIQAKGTVVKFDPETMKYTVSIPNVTVGGASKDAVGSVMRIDRNVWKPRHGVGSQASLFQQPRVGKVVMVRVCNDSGFNCRWQRGKIVDYHRKDSVTTPVGLRDYLYTLEAGGKELTNRIWSNDQSGAHSTDWYEIVSAGTAIQEEQTSRNAIESEEVRKMESRTQPDKKRGVWIELPGEDPEYGYIDEWKLKKGVVAPDGIAPNGLYDYEYKLKFGNGFVPEDWFEYGKDFVDARFHHKGKLNAREDYKLFQQHVQDEEMRRKRSLLQVRSAGGFNAGKLNKKRNNRGKRHSIGSALHSS